MPVRGGPARFSGVILAGGRSTRMGRDKRALRLNGKTLLELQADKLRTLGIEDILLSGAGCPPLPGARVIPDEYEGRGPLGGLHACLRARVIPDEYEGRGPLGGLHACLRAARNPACLVMSVDVPLIPTEALAALCEAHRGGVTVLRHGAVEEPLIGVYDSAAADAIAALLDSGRGAVRALGDVLPWNPWSYNGPEELLLNCNTPEDFARIQEIAARCHR